MKIKLHSNENIEMHAPWIGFKFLNWIQIHYLELDQIELNSNSTIQFKFDWKQNGGECIENALMNMVLEKKLKKNTNPKRHISIPLYFTRKGLNIFWVWIWQDEILWNPIVVLPKQALMNHCQ
jgi:hypothetical protein